MSSGKKIMLMSQAGARETVINCAGAGRGFYFHIGEDRRSVVHGFTVCNGNSTNLSDSDGGAILCRNSSPTITDCVISNNSASIGGGISCWNSNPLIHGCLIHRNLASSGGGIYCGKASPTISNCTITKNDASNPSSGWGGGICCNNSMPTIVNCMIGENVAESGGGIRCFNGSRPVAQNTVITKNRASRGGGIDNETSSLLLQNCAIVNNSTDWRGSALLCLGSGVPTIVNTIIWNNPLIGSNAEGRIFVASGASNPVITFSDVEGGWTGLNNITNNPLVTRDGHLQKGSLCIGAGNLNLAPATDMDGEPRSGRADIGCDQYIDADNDGLPNWWEMKYYDGSRTAGAPTNNPDGDELNNLKEYFAGTNPKVNPGDSDRDGLSDDAEAYHGTDPLNWDSDGDLFPDGWEVRYNFDPNAVTSPAPGADKDGDGLSNFDEMRRGTNPTLKDTDEDGKSDGYEAEHGSDPADASDQGKAANCVSIALAVGDHSGSQSERYALKVGDHVSHVSPQFGVVATSTYAFVKGKAYSFEIRWIANDPTADCDPRPDYDYTARIGGLPPDDPHPGWLYGANFIVHDPSGILGQHDESSPFYAEGKTGTLYVPKMDLDVDSNNDGTIDSDDSNEDKYEEYAPGKILCVNRQGDGTALDHIGTMKINLSPGLSIGWLVVSAESGGEHIRIWKDALLTQELLLGDGIYLPDGYPSDLWIDGVSEGQVILILQYITEDGSLILDGDKVAIYIAKTVSWSPAGHFAYSWEPCAWVNDGGVYHVGSDEAMDQIKDQGWNVTVARRMINSYAFDDVGDCTLANFKEMRLGGFIIVNTHGIPDSIFALYLKTEARINNWINGESDIVARRPLEVPGRWSASVSTVWFENNWKSDLDANKAVTFWMVCDSGTWGSGSIAAEAGGWIRLGYNGTMCGAAAKHDSEGIFGRMNGSIEVGSKRSLHGAWKPGGYDHVFDNDGNLVDYTIVKFGNDWVTLCPSPVAVFPSSSPGPRKGWGCIVFDTYMDDNVAASTALTKTSGSCSVSNIRWLDNGSGKYAIGFDFDNTSGGGATMTAHADKCENKAAPTGVNLGRKLDGDRVKPNGDDKTWPF